VDTSLYLIINGWAGRVRFIDEIFKGISNDYFAVLLGCLTLLWLWFATRDKASRDKVQKAVLMAAMSIGFAGAMVDICNIFYTRPRPFMTLPASSVHILFYRPTDSSFPSNFASIMFAFVIPVIFANRKYGLWLLGLALITSFGRVFMGIHYPLDVTAGAVIGILTGFLAMGVGWVINPVMDYILLVLRKIGIA